MFVTAVTERFSLEAKRDSVLGGLEEGVCEVKGLAMLDGGACADEGKGLIPEEEEGDGVRVGVRADLRLGEGDVIGLTGLLMLFVSRCRWFCALEPARSMRSISSAERPDILKVS